MSNKARSVQCGVVVGLMILTAIVPAFGQRQRVAVCIQAAAPVPSAQLEILKSFANQRCAVIADVEVCSTGELMYAQRFTNTYIGNSISVNGMRRLAQTLDADHIVIFRIVRWENQLSFKPEWSLLLVGATSFFDSSLKLLASPLGILFGLEKEATVALFATVFSPSGDVEFTTMVTYADQSLFSLITADPLEAAKRAIETALFQLTVAL